MTTESNNTSSIISKVWSFCNTLRDDGVGYGDYLEQLTFLERFWRTLKYEDIYLNDHRTLMELKEGIKCYMSFYNGVRFHASQRALLGEA